MQRAELWTTEAQNDGIVERELISESFVTSLGEVDQNGHDGRKNAKFGAFNCDHFAHGALFFIGFQNQLVILFGQVKL